MAMAITAPLPGLDALLKVVCPSAIVYHQLLASAPRISALSYKVAMVMIGQQPCYNGMTKMQAWKGSRFHTYSSNGTVLLQISTEMIMKQDATLLPTPTPVNTICWQCCACPERALNVLMSMVKWTCPLVTHEHKCNTPFYGTGL